MIEVPTSTASITADWLTRALKSNGHLAGTVTDVVLEPIGAGVGLMAELGRLRLTYAGDEDLPDTMIAKCAAQNENIQVAQVLDFYNREVNFYNRVGSDCLLNVPDSYYGDVNQETYNQILLMEDLGDVSPRDQIVGASAEEAESAVNRIAAMYARYWNKVGDATWMYDFMSVPEAEKLRSMVYMPALEPAIEKFGSFFDATSKDLVRRVGANYQHVWVDQLTPNETFIHGDYRQDNMLYQGDSLDAKVMDWQISGRGKGIFDVTYFMCQSLPSSLRKDVEQDLLKGYVKRLNDAGVAYTFDQCWHDYRVLLLGCLIYPITVCGTLDTANERGRLLGECMLERNLTAIDELGCGEFV